MAKHDARGRSKGEARHIRLPHIVTGSPAWSDLSGNAIKLLIALQRLDYGDNNGNLYFSARKASLETGLARNTVMKGFLELENHGFIGAMDRGYFQVKGGPATRWRITFRSAPFSNLPATNEWQQWKPLNDVSRAQIRTELGSQIEPNKGNTSETSVKIAPTSTETPLVSVELSGSKSAPQLHCHSGEANAVDSATQKHANNRPDRTAGLPIGNDALTQVRDQVKTYLSNASAGTQSRLAADSDIPGGTLSKFLSGRGLNVIHLQKLQAVLDSPNIDRPEAMRQAH